MFLYKNTFLSKYTHFLCNQTTLLCLAITNLCFTYEYLVWMCVCVCCQLWVCETWNCMQSASPHRAPQVATKVRDFYWIFILLSVGVGSGACGHQHQTILANQPSWISRPVWSALVVFAYIEWNVFRFYCNNSMWIRFNMQRMRAAQQLQIMCNSCAGN